MKDINEIMPKIPGMRFGAVTNLEPSVTNINELIKIMPRDERWHTLFEGDKEMLIDGVSVRRRTADSMT